MKRAGLVQWYLVGEPLIFRSVAVDGFRDSSCRASIRAVRNGLCMGFGLPDVAEPPIDLGVFFPEILEVFFEFFSLSFGSIFVPLFILPQNAANAGLQRAALLRTATKEVDAERAQFRRNQPFKN